MRVDEKMHRREGFSYNYNDEGFKKFLEENRVIAGSDPVNNTLSITKNALFTPITQTQNPSPNQV